MHIIDFLKNFFPYLTFHWHFLYLSSKVLGLESFSQSLLLELRLREDFSLEPNANVFYNKHSYLRRNHLEIRFGRSEMNSGNNIYNPLETLTLCFSVVIQSHEEKKALILSNFQLGFLLLASEKNLNNKIQHC